MAFTLYSLLEATLLCLNAVCILHEERFLAKSMSVNLLGGCRNAHKCKRGVASDNSDTRDSNATPIIGYIQE